MDKRLRVLIGTLILVVTIGSAVVIGVLLPQSSINQMDEINARLSEFGRLNEDDFIPKGGTENLPDWLYTGISEKDSRFYDQAYFEFFNVSDRRGFLDYNTPISYFFVQGELVFDITINKTIKAYDIDNDYVVYAIRKQYTFNESASTLSGNEKVLNFNYMWPYYIEKFGNGTEYGFQAYIAKYLINLELEQIKNLKGWTDSEVAYATLNRVYAEANGIVDLGIYLPHNWISVRPAYKSLDFDQATSYKILYNATYNGHDYSLITGEYGSQKYFLDIVKGLYYDPADITIDPIQLLADIYGIDTDSERSAAMSLAAYLNYLLNQPALNWLYDNKISYVCARTTMEWILGIEDPLLGYSFPLVRNQTLSSDSINWDDDIYYAEKLGTYHKEDTNEIIAIANIPYYEHSKSKDVTIQGNYAYVLEGNDIKIVNITSPLFLAVGQYGDNDGIIESFDVCGDYIYAAEGSNGLEIIDAMNKQYLGEHDQWSFYGVDDMRDLEILYFPENGDDPSLILANGQYGVDIITINGTNGIPTDDFWSASADGIVYAIDASNETTYGANYVAYAALGTDGIDTFTIDPLSPAITPAHHYTSLDFPILNNVIDVKADGYNLYVLDAVEGLLIFQLGITAGTINSFLGQYPYLSGEPYNNLYVDEENDLVYLTKDQDGLVVVDVSVKASPTEAYTFTGFDHLGTALGVYANGDDIYLGDYEQGLVHLQKQESTGDIIFIEKDELHTFAENWQKDSKVQFGGWDLGPTALLEGISFNQTYSSYSTYPSIEKGLRLQWLDLFLRPFAYTSLTDTALFFDEEVYYYKAEYQDPYRQMEKFSLYWMTDANFINSSFIYAGRWNQMYNLELTPQDLFITHSFPGQYRDPFHMHEMFVEPTTGSVVERRDRIQYNTYAIDYFEFYSYLDPYKFGLNDQFFNPRTDLEPFNWYPNWHTTFPGLPGSMATLFWQEDVRRATSVFYVDIKEQFLNQIKGADASRTGGAFGAMFLVSVGFIVTSVVLNRSKRKEE